MPSAADSVERAEVRMSHLTVQEIFALFHRSNEDVRWLASADAEEYLGVVTHHVGRNSQQNAA
jgi:hypothetical protein